jgi:hypothetical protein
MRLYTGQWLVAAKAQQSLWPGCTFDGLVLGPNGTLLLINDETMLRQAVVRTLGPEGYTVRQARMRTVASKPCANALLISRSCFPK